MQNILNQLTDLDENQLLELNAAVCRHIKFLRAAKGRAVKSQLREGDKVQWVGKKGHKVGEVIAIKRKFAHVSEGGYMWRVPMNMLSVMP